MSTTANVATLWRYLFPQSHKRSHTLISEGEEIRRCVRNYVTSVFLHRTQDAHHPLIVIVCPSEKQVSRVTLQSSIDTRVLKFLNGTSTRDFWRWLKK